MKSVGGKYVPTLHTVNFSLLYQSKKTQISFLTLTETKCVMIIITERLIKFAQK